MHVTISFDLSFVRRAGMAVWSSRGSGSGRELDLRDVAVAAQLVDGTRQALVDAFAVPSLTGAARAHLDERLARALGGAAPDLSGNRVP
jgi:hypothetical protein